MICWVPHTSIETKAKVLVVLKAMKLRRRLLITWPEVVPSAPKFLQSFIRVALRARGKRGGHGSLKDFDSSNVFGVRSIGIGSLISSNLPTYSSNLLKG